MQMPCRKMRQPFCCLYIDDKKLVISVFKYEIRTFLSQILRRCPYREQNMQYGKSNK